MRQEFGIWPVAPRRIGQVERTRIRPTWRYAGGLAAGSRGPVAHAPCRDGDLSSTCWVDVSPEGAADQDLLGATDVGERAIHPDLVARDREVSHVVGGHRAGAPAHGDESHGAEVECDPELRTVGDVYIADPHGQEAEPAAAAELRLVGGGRTTRRLAIEGGSGQRLGQYPAGR